MSDVSTQYASTKEQIAWLMILGVWLLSRKALADRAGTDDRFPNLTSPWVIVVRMRASRTCEVLSK
jgi:hypothetical protein